ncbi:MAG TPA: SAM-dependent methyltransferase [Kineosporiaceae bacterium]
MTADSSPTAAGQGGRSTEVPVDLIDTTVAHSARVYDFWLGGKDHYTADRAAGMAVVEHNPGIVPAVRANRRFLVRAVRHLVGEVGLRQILDIGTGLPSTQPVHEVAQAVAPSTRVVYVDNDPIVIIHARALLRGQAGRVTYVDADVRDVDGLLTRSRESLDLSQPVVVMLLMIMQFVPDEADPYAIVRRLMDALPSGSHLALSHPARDDGLGIANTATQRYNERVATPMTRRSREEILRFFDGLTLIEPGLVQLPDWRPDQPVAPDRAGEVADDVPDGGGDDAEDAGDLAALLESAARSDAPVSPAYCGIARKD